MKVVDKILNKISRTVSSGDFERVETEKIELKKLSNRGEWRELYKTACAFLNTDGGIIITGIHEIENKTYYITGYDGSPSSENKIKELYSIFTDIEKNKLDLKEFFHFEVRELNEIQVCVIYVEKLPDEKKYVFYKDKAYKRNLTGDHRLKQIDIDRFEEYKEEIVNARELAIVPNATISLINIEKLNEYITELNRDVKVESLKAEISAALPFLTRKKFIRNNEPTFLGMLVCGDYLSDYIGNRCQVDAYVDSEHQIASNKKIFKDNIINLMSNSVQFVYQNTPVAIDYSKGGSKIPLYPQKLIRETINNALAHRDYSDDKFVYININPNEFIEIGNPGKFRAEQLILTENANDSIRIRRIIPIAKPRNPRLADVLKVYDRWEGRGIGMASLTNACLEEKIDVPYYLLGGQNTIRLFIRPGKVLDTPTKNWLEGYSGYIMSKTYGVELTKQEQIVLGFFYKSEILNNQEKFTIMLTPDNNHFAVIHALEQKGLIHRSTNSPQYHPIYLVDRHLIKSDFSEELYGVFGYNFTLLPQKYKLVLNAIYFFNENSLKEVVSASQIGDYLFNLENISEDFLKKYENFKRSIRNIFNKLESRNMIYRKDGKSPKFLINKDFRKENTLF